MTLSERLESAWATMAAGEEKDALFRTLVDFGLPANCRLGIDSSRARELHFEVPVSADVSGVPNVQGVRVFVRTVHLASGTQRSLVLRCADPSSHRVFTQFAADVLTQVASAANMAERVMEVLADWREMFRRVATESESFLRGVFGELHELMQVASHSPKAIGSWLGPEKMPRDFEAGRLALEVKSSKWLPRSVEVHGLEQLCAEGFDVLLLVAKHVPVTSKGQTVGDMVDSLARLNVDPSVLWDKLAQIDLNRDKLLDTPGPRFDVASSRYYSITKASPVLTPASLKAGSLPSSVSHIAYQLDLSALEPCPAGLVEKVHQGLAGK